ncbi:13641_t:CDS:2 [Cetraspora pellucida]|uniref:13641_t:CDS:1 n=1 Tax=Cetraspora pellucida TaxID=1433469 RepID=A0A9N9GT44_9GLOM|nr:13641_t:CDS:2 [Cetraspora pellucida]
MKKSPKGEKNIQEKKLHRAIRRRNYSNNTLIKRRRLSSYWYDLLPTSNNHNPSPDENRGPISGHSRGVSQMQNERKLHFSHDLILPFEISKYRSLRSHYYSNEAYISKKNVQMLWNSTIETFKVYNCYNCKDEIGKLGKVTCDLLIYARDTMS